jgi:RNA polymerase sigma factor (sigma-70 family)
MKDTILIQNILNGDAKSEKILYDKYYKILLDFLKNKYPNNKEYEDDVSEILIKVFISLPKYKSQKSKFKTWVFTIAKNYMIDKLRCVNKSNNNSYNIISDNDTFTLHNNVSLTSDTITYSVNNDINITSECTFQTCDYINFENEVSVDHISNQISSCDFTFLNMHYGYGYTYCEIGSEFNVSSNTVSNRVNYLKNKLKENNTNEIIY